MIRNACGSDCINLAALSLDVWLQTYSVDGICKESSTFALSTFTEEYFKQRLRDSKYRCLVFEDGMYIRGFTLINLESRFQSDVNGFEIEKLYVHSPFQGRGIGRKLLAEIKEQFGDRFWLYTWVRNKSVGFYEKCGFKNIGSYSFMFGADPIENHVFGYGGSS
ncbi:GNAT family N-acetyltransferase [Desulfoluna spongiiphila]|uniref:Acetyltransferase (GNAT) family protein n=1 Tax=Desulfoluna spongiiphila TaxID=419481 RepID=A0A1G5BMK6_9BACT|nr:GNAT family N-acetyltransferase [Desulfoluna spongiiphila]SCX91393.1 Acetyltransferase (GNAT) family protein [Desulfoluna spongiiphila]